jgi:ABC-type sugar transport system, periplasmic component
MVLGGLTTLSAQSYPIKGSPSLSYWMVQNANWMNRYANFGDTPFAKELMKETGVTLNFTHPAAGQEAQSFNLMLASGDLTDLIEYQFDKTDKVPGGPEKLIKDGYILRLNDAIKKWAPNLTAYLKAHPEVDRMVKTDEGSYYCFPFIRGDPYLQTYQGAMLRQDWLDELGLKVPTTIDEWTTVLRAFKTKKGAPVPLTWYIGINFGEYNNPAFSGAYGAIRDWYVEKGKVKYGPYESQYKDFIKLFADWYKEGLLDPNIALVDAKMRDALITSGQTGATIGNTGGSIGYYTKLMADKDPKFKLVAAPYPTLKKGEKPKFGQYDLPVQASVAISAKCKNIEAAVRLLDYGYSKEGQLLYNFGTAGKTYAMQNGKPIYTDFILNNPDKLPMSEAMGANIRGNSNGPFVQDKGFMEQYSSLPQQQESIRVWSGTDMAKYKLPPTTPSSAEMAEMSKIMSEVTTYVNEQFVAMVIGSAPVSDFDKYMATLKKLNIEKAIAIQQAAYDRYLKR